MAMNKSNAYIKDRLNRHVWTMVVAIVFVPQFLPSGFSLHVTSHLTLLSPSPFTWQVSPKRVEQMLKSFLNSNPQTHKASLLLQSVEEIRSQGNP
jgi:hypothetical protein